MIFFNPHVKSSLLLYYIVGHRANQSRDWLLATLMRKQRWWVGVDSQGSGRLGVRRKAPKANFTEGMA